MLPSPAWKTLPMRRRWRAAAAAMRAQDLGHARARHDAVLRAVVRREAADGAEGALAALPQRGALGVVARRARSSRAPLRAHRRLRRAPSARRARPRVRRARPSARRRRRSASRCDTPPRRRRGSGGPSSRAPRARCRAAMMPDTASLASSTDSKTASSVRYASGARIRRSVARVTMPKVPSEPTTRPARS